MTYVGVNYFRVQSCQSLGNAMVALELEHEYGIGPPVRLPISGEIAWYPVGSRLEVGVKVVANPEIEAVQ